MPQSRKNATIVQFKGLKQRGKNRKKSSKCPSENRHCVIVLSRGESDDYNATFLLLSMTNDKLGKNQKIKISIPSPAGFPTLGNFIISISSLDTFLFKPFLFFSNK